eukprot:5676261-Pyramimonas_sp.AAC.1
MLIAREPEALQAHLDLVIDVGKNYGLELSAGKTILLKIRSNWVVHGPDGKDIACMGKCRISRWVTKRGWETKGGANATTWRN